MIAIRARPTWICVMTASVSEEILLRKRCILRFDDIAACGILEQTHHVPARLGPPIHPLVVQQERVGVDIGAGEQLNAR